jgi:hypothetical protein
MNKTLSPPGPDAKVAFPQSSDLGHEFCSCLPPCLTLIFLQTLDGNILLPEQSGKSHNNGENPSTWAVLLGPWNNQAYGKPSLNRGLKDHLSSFLPLLFLDN